MSAAEVAARAWRDAFPKPIVTVRMTEAQYEAALVSGSEREVADLVAGLDSGQIQIEEGSE